MIYFPSSGFCLHRKACRWENKYQKLYKIGVKDMLIGKIVGSVVSTRKNEKLIGSKFMIVETCAGTGNAKRIVAVDNVGAGIGELVLVATGSAARIGCDQPSSPIDAAIVGIIDSGTGISAE